jgi:hypothetical protein
MVSTPRCGRGDPSSILGLGIGFLFFCPSSIPFLLSHTTMHHADLLPPDVQLHILHLLHSSTSTQHIGNTSYEQLLGLAQHAPVDLSRISNASAMDRFSQQLLQQLHHQRFVVVDHFVPDPLVIEQSMREVAGMLTANDLDAAGMDYGSNKYHDTTLRNDRIRWFNHCSQVSHAINRSRARCCMCLSIACQLTTKAGCCLTLYSQDSERYPATASVVAHTLELQHELNCVCNLQSTSSQVVRVL